jgi:hypothetical protein
MSLDFAVLLDVIVTLKVLSHVDSLHQKAREPPTT